MGTSILRFLAACALLGAAGCELADETQPPQWLAEQILEYEKHDPGEVPSQIWMIRHGGERAYYVVSPCCDGFNPLYDAKGKEICAPDGGFTGHGDGKCPARIVDEGTVPKLVWTHFKAPEVEAVPPQFPRG